MQRRKDAEDINMISYQCPSCGAPLAYGAESGKLECSACGNEYELDALEVMNESVQEQNIRFDMTGKTFDDASAEHVQAYICQACGADLLTEDTTTATECPYCGSPTVLPEQIKGGVKPEMVVPFAVSKQQAQQEFDAYFKGKLLLPNVFLNTRNRIAQMHKLYVPYWLFDCTAGGSIVYNARKESTYRQGDWEITETEHYIVKRQGSMSFENILVDGSMKLDNKITESLEPYDLSTAVPFVPAVLAGAMADRADVDSEQCQQRAVQRVEESMERALNDTVVGYSSVTTQSKSFCTRDEQVTPALMPVWLMSMEKEGRTYTFAVNGQTGKLTCDVPVDKGKAVLWGGGVFAAVMALACVMFYFSGMLDDAMILISALIALIVSAVTVVMLIAQLNRAESVSGAANYVVQDSFALEGRADYYLRTTTTRRRIEQEKRG